MSKTIIITGGSDGLGKEMAYDLARDNDVAIAEAGIGKMGGQGGGSIL